VRHRGPANPKRDSGPPGLTPRNVEVLLTSAPALRSAEFFGVSVNYAKGFSTDSLGNVVTSNLGNGRLQDMAANAKRVDNPLTLIAYFAGISESITLAVLPILASTGVSLPTGLIWFCTLFPVFIAILFFGTLNFNHLVLYAPSDFEDQSHFLAILHGQYSKPADHENIIKKFWKPDGIINKENQKVIQNWLQAKGMPSTSVSAFLYSSDKNFVKARSQFIEEQGI
jgi:hypothetical protein